MVEIETEMMYEMLDDQEFTTFFSGDGYDDPMYWDLLVNKYLSKNKE